METVTVPVFLIAALAMSSLPAHADQASASEKIKAAMASPIRTEAEIARDGNRKPVETLAFLRLRDNMRVLELLPGGGWYTKLLAPTLREHGELYEAIGTGQIQQELLPQKGFDRVKVLQIGAVPERSGPFRTNQLAPFDFGVVDLDLALTFRNMHNFTPEARRNIDAAVFRSLRSGGLYGIVDHTRRHMEPMTDENRRRSDPVQIIHEVLAAGFEFVDYSDLHYRPDDELRYEVGRKTVTGNTDRFTLLFRKP